jgi:sugar phosphate isomerase/epimerase
VPPADQTVNAARLVRNALAHHGGKETDQLKKVSHGVDILDGVLQVMPADWPQHIKKLQAIGYNGTITLEVFPPQKEYLLLSRDLLRKWWTET